MSETKEIRQIDDKFFSIDYVKENGKLIAKVYLNDEFCFDMDGELDTDIENEYIHCWNNLEN